MYRIFDIGRLLVNDLDDENIILSTSSYNVNFLNITLSKIDQGDHTNSIQDQLHLYQTVIIIITITLHSFNL